MRVAVIGAGAVGSLLGGTLAVAGHEVSLLRRSAPNGAHREPLTIIGPSSEQRRAEVTIARTPDAIFGSPDVILVAVKMPDLVGALESAAAWPAATVVAVENGVGADEVLLRERPGGGLVAGSLTASVEVASGAVRRLSRGGIGLAAVRGDVGLTIRALANAFELGGLRARTLSDARAMRWSKLLANLLGNASSAILDVEPGVVYRDRTLFEIERRQLREALAVMRGLGLRPVALPGADVRLLAMASRLPPSLVRPVIRRIVAGGRGGKSPSLRRHLQSAGGPTEIAWLNGAVARAAVEMGRRAPVNERLAALVEECRADPERWAWFRGRPDRLLGEFRSIREG